MASKGELSMFICKNINNVPCQEVIQKKQDSQIRLKTNSKHRLKATKRTAPVEDDEDLSLYKEDFLKIQNQVEELSASVLDIKQQVESFINNSPLNPRKRQKFRHNNCTKKSISLRRDDACYNRGSDYHHDPTDENQSALEESNWLDDSNKQNIIMVSPSSSSVTKVMQDKVEKEKIIYIKEEFNLDLPNETVIASTVKEEKITSNTHQPRRRRSSEEEDTILIDASRPNQCDICSESFDTDLNLEIHMESHPYKNQYDCILCDESFRTRKYLRKHFLRCYKDNEERLLLEGLICTVCGRMYGDTTALRQHKNVHSLSKPYPCSHCTYRYLTKSALDTHIKTLHNKLNKYFCPFCEHSYISNNYLLVHIRTHTGEKPFKCKVCDYKAATPSMVTRHMKRHEPQEEFACDMCDYVCKGPENLRSHKSKMHRERLIVCRVCGRQFKNASVYSNHFLTHTGIKSFKCSLCCYAGLTKAVLKSHMKVHSGSDPLTCPICSMPFRTKFSYKRHLCTHKN